MYGPIQSYQDFYQQQWYRKLLLLIYLLSLAVAGDLMVTFAWIDWTEDSLRYLPFLSYVAIFYAIWFSLNLVIVWLYTIVCLSLGGLVPSLQRPRTVSFALQRLRYKISKTQLRCLQSIFWNAMVLLLVGTSVAFDLRYKWYRGPNSFLVGLVLGPKKVCIHGRRLRTFQWIAEVSCIDT